MGICFIFLIFGLSVSAEEEDLRGYQSMQNGSTAFKTTSSPEEQASSARSDGNASTERSALLTMPVIGSPGTDLFHAPYDRRHASRVNTTTNTDKDAITSNDSRFVSVYGTDSLFMSVNGTAEKRLQSRADLLLISNDEGGVRTSAETEFESMMNDTTTPSAPLSRGREKILSFFHGSMNSKNQTVLDSITFSPAKGIPMVSASDPAVIDNLGESDESVERRSKNRNENWTLGLFRTSDPQKLTEHIQGDEVSLNNIHTTVMQFTVLQDKGLLTTLSSSEFKTGQRSEHEPKEKRNLTSSVILNQPLQVKSTSQMVDNKMIENSRNPTTNGPKILEVSINVPNEKHRNAMFLFSTSKLTPTNTPDSTMLNYYFNVVISAAGEVHVTKQFATSQLISEDLPKSVSAGDTLESKLIFHTESSKERHFKQTLPFQTSTNSFLHRLNKSNVGPPRDIFSATHNSLSSPSHLLRTLDLHTKASIETRTPNVSVIEKHNGIDHVPVLLSKLKAFNTASFSSTEEASMPGDERIVMQKTQSSFSPLPTLLPQVNTLKHLNQFEKLSTASSVTKPQSVFHVSRANNYSLIKQSQIHLPSETLRFFVSSPSQSRQTQATVESNERRSSFTSMNVKRFTNIQNLTEFYSTNQNRENTMSQTVSSLISQRPNVSMSTEILTVNETVKSTTEFTSLFVVPLVVLTSQTSNSSLSKTSSVTSAWATESLISHLSLEPQVSVSDRLSSHATSQKFLTPFSKSQNIVTAKVFSKLLGVGKNSNSETIFFNHPTTENLGLSSGSKEQDLENPKGTEMIFSSHFNVNSIPSVQQLSKPRYEEASLTATPPSQSKVQTESNLKMRDSTTLNGSSIVGMNQTSLKTILHNIVSLSQNVGSINSTSVSPVVYSTPEFKQDLTIAALFEAPMSSEQAMTQPSVPHFTVQPITPVMSIRKDNTKDLFLTHQVLSTSTDAQEHLQNMAFSQISGITESLSRHKTNTTAVTQTGGLTLSSSPLPKLSSGTVSPALPLFLFQMQTVVLKKHLTLSENQTEFSTTVNGQFQTTQPNVPSNEKYSSGTTEDQKLFGQTALSAVAVDEFSHVYPTDLGFSSTKAQMLPNSSLQTSGGSEDGATPYDESDSEKATDFVSDLPVINRKRRIILPDSLSGVAQISDDICGTGNYTAEMSLNLEREIKPGDLIPAFGNLRVVINLKTNNSHADLEIKSCCLSPTIRLDKFNTTCCIFSEQATDPHAIRPLPGDPSKTATFTIRLFQMINYSSAYLHCDLSVCLRNHSGCERWCGERRKALPVDRTGAAFSSTGSRISFGPVLKGSDNSSTETAADTEAAEVIISSVAGCLLACLALLLVWTNRRCLERPVCCWSRALCEC